MKEIIIYKSLEDANDHFMDFKKNNPGVNMLVLEYIDKIHDLNFKDYGYIVSYKFNIKEKDILSRKVKKDAQKEKTNILIRHIY